MSRQYELGTSCRFLQGFGNHQFKESIEWYWRYPGIGYRVVTGVERYYHNFSKGQQEFVALNVHSKDLQAFTSEACQEILQQVADFFESISRCRTS